MDTYKEMLLVCKWIERLNSYLFRQLNICDIDIKTPSMADIYTVPYLNNW